MFDPDSFARESHVNENAHRASSAASTLLEGFVQKGRNAFEKSRLTIRCGLNRPLDSRLRVPELRRRAACERSVAKADS